MPESNLITQWGSYFLKGNFRLVRNTFSLAGQDSFTDPPAQNTDMFSQLVNVQPPVRGDLNRRWGYGLQTIGAFPDLSGAQQVVTGSVYQNTLTDSRQLVYAAENNPVVATSEAGVITNPNIFTPTSANPTRMLNARNYGYFANGRKGEYLKWDGATTVTNWGIDINDVGGTTAGPNGPSTATDLGTGTGPAGQEGPNGFTTVTFVGTSTTPWVGTQVIFPGNSGGTTNNYQATGFGFSIPSIATITGIVAQYHTSCNQPFTVSDSQIQLVKAGVVVGQDLSNGNDWYPNSTQTYGSASTLWGVTWTPADINNPNFGFTIQASASASDNGKNTTARISSIRLTVYYSMPTGGTWTNPNNILVADGVVATSLVSTTPTSTLQATNFGFGVGGTILGIQVDVLCSTSGTPLNIQPQLVKGGAAFGLTKTASIVSTTLGYLSFGGTTDLWGGTWLNSDINSANFGVEFALTASGSGTVSVDFVRITVFTTVPPITLGAPAGGAVTLTVGRIYTVAFQNSITGDISNIAPFTVSTGPLTAQEQPLTAIPVSLDPQVDSKLILATADGGDETTLYFVAEIANSATTYTDDTPETTLLLNNIYLDQDTTGNTLGVADNDPPPIGSQFPVNHRGRVYMATANKLYYSKAESDLVTASGTLCGKYEECWPALNNFALASEAESITGLLSDGQVLYIGTNVKVIRLYGDGPATFQEPEALFKHTGVLNQDVWNMVFLQGNPLGAMWLTPDYRILGSDFNTYQDIGQPVQNILDTINTQVAADVCWASYVGISNWNLYVLAVPTGTNTQPDTLLVFDLRNKLWFVWQATDVMLGGLYNISLAGDPQFISIANTGVIYNWGPQFTQDRVNHTPLSFPVTLESSWQDFTDAAARKYLNEIEIITGDTTMTVTIEGASTAAEFASPNTVVANAPLSIKPRGEFFVPLAARMTKDRYYRYRLTSNDIGTNILRGVNIQGGVIHRL